MSLFAKTNSDWLKLKTCPQGRGLGALNGGAFEQLFALGRWEFEQPNFQKFKCLGVCWEEGGEDAEVLN